MSTKSILFIILCCYSFSWKTPAQNPNKHTETKATYIEKATIHIGNGQVINKGFLLIENGLITYVSETPLEDTRDMEIINAEGQHLYPGFIALNSDLGLVEIDAIDASDDRQEVGQFTPNIRSIISYNTDNDRISTYKFNGILLAQVVPEGGTMPGQSSVVHLDGNNWEDDVVATDQGIHIKWPKIFLAPKWWLGETQYSKNLAYDQTVEQISQILREAKYYDAIKDPSNLKMQALKGIYTHTKTVFIHTEESQCILESVLLMQELGIDKIVLVGGNGIEPLIPLIKEHNIPVILSDVHQIPTFNHHPVDFNYTLAGKLVKEGILVSLGYFYGKHGSGRNLAFFAGTVANYNLDWEQALQLITLNSAKTLGIDQKYGSIEKGKSATLFIAKGNALEMKGNIISHAFIEGRPTNINGIQQRLYEKYRSKYELK